MEMTPVGMLSRMASVKRRRRSSSRLLASSSSVIWLKPRTSDASSSTARTSTRCLQIALAHFARGVQQRGDGNADLLGQEQRDPGGHEQHEQRDQQHQHGVEQPVVLAVPLVLVELGGVLPDLACCAATSTGTRDTSTTSPNRAVPLVTGALAVTV